MWDNKNVSRTFKQLSSNSIYFAHKKNCFKFDQMRLRGVFSQQARIKPSRPSTLFASDVPRANATANFSQTHPLWLSRADSTLIKIEWRTDAMKRQNSWMVLAGNMNQIFSGQRLVEWNFRIEDKTLTSNNKLKLKPICTPSSDNQLPGHSENGVNAATLVSWSRVR